MIKDIFVAIIINVASDDYCEHFLELFLNEDKAKKYINNCEKEWQEIIKGYKDFNGEELNEWLEDSEENIPILYKEPEYYKHYIYDEGDEKIFAYYKFTVQ